MSTMRTTVVAVLVALLCAGGVSGVMLLRLHDYSALEDRATSTAKGEIIEDDIGEYGDIRVRWHDAAGSSHTTRFGIYDTDRYVTGAAFGVRFDPTDPDRGVFPSDREETSPEDDLWAGILLPWLLPLVLLPWWLIRALRTRRSRRGPGETALMTLLGGRDPRGQAAAGIIRMTWARLDQDGRTSYQKLHWQPAFVGRALQERVQVHRGAGTTSIALADGRWADPIGRTRSELPDNARLVPLATARPSLIDSVIRPAEAAADPWLRTLVLRLVAGALVGAIFGLLIGSMTLMWVAAMLGPAVAVNFWSFYGAHR